MDASSAPLSESKPTASGASKFLDGLPSSGLFSSTVISSNLGGMRVYITDHDTSPPEDQLIRTDQQNILIRSLVLKQQKGEAISKGAKGTGATEGSRKRPAEKAVDGKAKKPNTSMQEGSKSRAPDKNFQSLTVERLRALLKEKGLSVKGKKDELVSRLRETTAKEGLVGGGES